MSSKKSILLIEPDETERRELASILEKLDFKVEQAAGPKEGLELFSANRHDLVIVEVLLPGINGLEVCRRVREQGALWDVKVIVVSKIYKSRAMEHDAVARYGASAYFSRPFPLVQLVERIGELFDDPQVTQRAHQRTARRPTMPPPPPPPEKPPVPEQRTPPSARTAAPEPPAEKAKPETLHVEPLPDQGEVSPEEFGRLLMQLHREAAAGLLVVQRADQIKHIYWREGKPVFVKSSIPEESLGRMLLSDGVITEEQYQSAMVEMGETGKKFGSILAARGIVSSDDLYFHLVQQTKLKIARCFGWPAIQYEIDRNSHYPEEATTFENDVAVVVLDGYRDHLPPEPLEQIYEKTKGEYLFLGDPQAIAAARVHLRGDEGKLLSAVDGQKTLGETVGDSPLGLLAALRVIRALTAIGAMHSAPVSKHPDLKAYEHETPPYIEAPEAHPREENRYRDLKRFLVRMDDSDYFQLLGVEREATTEQINQAVTELQKKFHPDTFTIAAPERVHKMAVTVGRRLRKIHETLIDAAQREAYVRTLKKREAEGRRSPVSPPAVETGEPAAEPEKHAGDHYQNGLEAMSRQHWMIAVEHFRHAVRLAANNAEYRAALATAMFKYLDQPAIKWSEVEQATKHALSLDSGRADLVNILGKIKAAQGDDEKALLYFKKAVELDPRHQDYKRDERYAEQKLEADNKKPKRSFFGKSK